MTRRRIAVGGLAAAVAAVSLLLGGVLAESPASPGGALASAPRPEVVVERGAGGFSSGDTAGLVAQLESKVRERPGDIRSLVALGYSYQQRWRETADATYLGRSQQALGRAVRLAPNDADAVSGLAVLALSRHQFRSALALGRKARKLAPDTARHHGVAGDALLELGRYDEAFAAFDRMGSLKPGLGAYARVAYARELLGRPRQAIRVMELALDTARGQAEPTAWTSVELGKLHFGLGELAAAAKHFRVALHSFPGYVYALEALAKVEAARGNSAQAIELARQAVDAVPQPQFVATLGDLYAVSGRKAEAREQYAVIGAIEQLLRANGIRTDLETALFDIDHGFRLGEAMGRARQAHAERPGIVADDVLAWALVRNGKCAEGLRYAKRALRLGTRDASIFFHRGMAERCLGRVDEARTWFRRALDTNPHFSLLWAPVAKRYAS